MKIFTLRLNLLLLVIFTMALSVFAQEKEKEIPQAEVAETQHEVIIGGETIPLTALTGTMKLRDENNEPIALFGFTYYRATNGGKDRPILFAYNGGPGSSSFWLHMGVLGPKRIAVNDGDYMPAAPYPLENNQYSVLDDADLVMIDPVGTGLSIPVGDAEFKDFWGVDQDIRSIGLFITQFLINNGRMNSPKFLLGESYGTFRNAGVMKYLFDRGIALNGVIMVSAVFDLRTLIFPPNDDLPYLVHFPTYCATAWYHDKIEKGDGSLESFLDEVRTFTETLYMPALYKGSRLTEEHKMNIASKLEKYSGIASDYWIKADLRITNSEFFQQLFREEGKTVGRLDSRWTGINQDGISQMANYDPQSAAISPAYITGFLDYLYTDLGVKKGSNYSITAGRREGFSWDWKHEGNVRWNTQAAINTGIDMAATLSKDPNMKVLIMNGYYDLATVFYGVEHSIDHMGLRPETMDNIIMTYYEAGHMMYTHQPSLAKFKKDLSDFFALCLGNRLKP